MTNNPNSRLLSGFPIAFLPWLVFGLGTFVCMLLVGSDPWLQTYPENWVVPFGDFISIISGWIVTHFKWMFRWISWLISLPLDGMQQFLHWLPWPATISLFVLFAVRFGNWKLAVFTTCAFGYMVIVGYWHEAMNTLALVALAVPLSVLPGLFIGICAFRWRWLDRIIQPVLDIMQTVPAFAYLLPILFLFGFGPVVGVIATIIFAIPPMVRNTILGLRHIQSDIIESGLMSGCNPRQLFWQVEFPTALPQVMVGVNQTTMAALSMVIVAAIIGGFEDIGWEVLSTMRNAKFGESLLAGLVIALLAMVLDRLSAAAVKRQVKVLKADDTVFKQYRYLLLAIGCILGFVILGLVFPAIAVYPESWVFYPAQPMNNFLIEIVRNYSVVIEYTKKISFNFLMYPIQKGFSQAVNPFTWGFDLTPGMVWTYAIITSALALWCLAARHWKSAVSIALASFLLFYGVTKIPWPITMSLVTLIAFQAGGVRVAAFAFCSLIFILINGLWEPTMMSVYLCGIAVVVSMLVGGSIGIWAAHNDTVSIIIRPIIDTLQTMPAFVLLIPALMLFGIGEFTALLAIISFSIVPPIRYFEHGLRHVPPAIVEAAEQMGCTPRQMLIEVKLPLALPVIMLGLNQTIMYGLAMLVISSLVGTKDLGQLIYLALSRADVGGGVVAGFAMALIAMVADRILQARSRKWQEATG